MLQEIWYLLPWPGVWINLTLSLRVTTLTKHGSCMFGGAPAHFHHTWLNIIADLQLLSMSILIHPLILITLMPLPLTLIQAQSGMLIVELLITLHLNLAIFNSSPHIQVHLTLLLVMVNLFLLRMLVLLLCQLICYLNLLFLVMCYMCQILLRIYLAFLSFLKTMLL